MTSEAEPPAMGPGATELAGPDTDPDTGRTPGTAGSGDGRVDAALARLGELAGAPVAAHVEVFEEVHLGLQDVLAALDREVREGREDQGQRS